MGLVKDDCDIRDKTIWFCESCGQGNTMNNLECNDCGDAFKKSCLVFNIETFGAVIPERQDGSGSGTMPYWVDGGASMRPNVWE